MHIFMCCVCNVHDPKCYKSTQETINLTYAEGLVKYCEDLTEIVGFEEKITDRKFNGHTDKWANKQTNKWTTAKFVHIIKILPQCKK